MTNVVDDGGADSSWAPPSGPPAAGPWRVIRARRDRGIRSSQDGWIGGVCAGLAASIGVDVLLVRLAFVLASIGGVGVLVYIGLWLFTPRAGDGDTPEPRLAPSSVADAIKVALFIGAVLGLLGGVGIGVARPFRFDDGAGWIGLLLIAGGVFWLIRRHVESPDVVPPGRRPDERVPPPPPPPSRAREDVSAGAIADLPTPRLNGEPGSKTPTSEHERSTVENIDADEKLDDELASLDATLGLAPPGGGPPVAAQSAAGEPDGEVTAPDAEPRWGLAPAVFAWIGVLLVIGVKLAIGGLVAFDAVSAPRVGLLAIVATAGLIVMIVSASRRQSGALYGSGAGLVVLAIFTGAVWGSFNGPVGSHNYAVDAIGDLQPEYRVAFGELGIDLSNVDLGGGEQAVDVTVGIGVVDVIVPDDVDVRVDYEAQAGAIHIGSHRREGWDIRGTIGLDAGVDEPAGTLALTIDVGAGDANVCRTAAADLDAGHCRLR